MTLKATAAAPTLAEGSNSNETSCDLSGNLRVADSALEGLLGGKTFAQVLSSPFTLTSAWTKVATTTTATKGLRIAPIASATVYDIEWVAVVAGASTPTDTYGEPILAGEDFASGFPIGDIYLKSATGQIAIVKTGA